LMLLTFTELKHGEKALGCFRAQFY